MKKLTVIGLVLVMCLLVPVSCAQPGPPGAAADDLVTPPGGFTYRANVHQ